MTTKQKGLEKKDPVKELTEKLTGMLELPVEVPTIEDELLAAKQAMKKLLSHNCSNCGNTNIQLYPADARHAGKGHDGHFDCYLTEDNEWCDEHGEPFTDPDKLEALRQVRERGSVM